MDLGFQFSLLGEVVLRGILYLFPAVQELDILDSSHTICGAITLRSFARYTSCKAFVAHAECFNPIG